MSPRARSAESFHIGAWTADPADRTLERNGRTQQLSPLQMDLLVYLADNAGRVVSRNEILESVWAGAQIEEGGLTRCVAQRPDRHPHHVGLRQQPGRELQELHEHHRQVGRAARLALTAVPR